MYLPFSDLLRTKRTLVWFQINRKIYIYLPQALVTPTVRGLVRTPALVGAEFFPRGCLGGGQTDAGQTDAQGQNQGSQATCKHGINILVSIYLESWNKYDILINIYLLVMCLFFSSIDILTINILILVLQNQSTQAPCWHSVH